MPTAKINGFDMHFERHGDDGEPFVFVHGFTGDVTDWRHQISDFGKTHRVLVLDHRGHGHSSAPLDGYTIDQMSHDVEALIAEVGFERYHLLGHSMGGMVAQEIALRSPGRLMSLTLEDTGPDFAFGKLETVSGFMQKALDLAKRAGMAALAERQKDLPRPPHMSDERRAEEKARMSRMPYEGYAGAWQAMCGWQGSKDRAGSIAAAPLVIYGELDTMNHGASKWLADNIPGTTLHMVPQAGHSPQYERPDLFNAAVRAHLQRSTGTAAK